LRGACDVGPVVDEEECVHGTRETAEGACRFEQLAAARDLQPELEHPGTSGEQRRRKIGRGPARVEGIDGGVQRPEDEARPPSGPPTTRRIGMPSSVIFFRRVLRLMPSMSAAFTWLPPARSRTTSISGRSTALMRVL